MKRCRIAGVAALIVLVLASVLVGCGGSGGMYDEDMNIHLDLPGDFMGWFINADGDIIDISNEVVEGLGFIESYAGVRQLTVDGVIHEDFFIDEGGFVWREFGSDALNDLLVWEMP